MSTPNDNNGISTESRIIDAAKSLFIEKGYAETSMSDIAARAEINRPALHYYFRTKGKMFHAVIGDIVSAIVPRVYELLMQRGLPIADRIEGVIDAYFALFKQNPRLPMFILREMNRDAGMLIDTITRLHLKEKLETVILSIENEMESGKLNRIPVRFLFFNFYGMLLTPFLAQDLVCTALLEDGETFDQMLAKWKPCIMQQMLNLLQPR